MKQISMHELITQASPYHPLHDDHSTNHLRTHVYATHPPMNSDSDSDSKFLLPYWTIALVCRELQTKYFVTFVHATLTLHIKLAMLK